MNPAMGIPNLVAVSAAYEIIHGPSGARGEASRRDDFELRPKPDVHFRRLRSGRPLLARATLLGAVTLGCALGAGCRETRCRTRPRRSMPPMAFRLVACRQTSGARTECSRTAFSRRNRTDSVSRIAAIWPWSSCRFPRSRLAYAASCTRTCLKLYSASGAAPIWDTSCAVTRRPNASRSLCSDCKGVATASRTS